MKLIYLPFVSLLSALMLQGCGGGGDGDNTDLFESGPTYSGLTTEAKVDTASSLDLANAAVSGGAIAVDAYSFANEYILDSAPRIGSKLLTISPRIASLAGKTGDIYAAKPIDVSADACPYGGSAIEDVNDSQTAGTTTFRDCRDEFGMVLNGTINLTYIPAQDSLSEQIHLSISNGIDSLRLDWSVACTDISISPNCEVSSDFSGIDSRVYRQENTGINGDEYSGYNIVATVYDPDHGHFDMTTSGAILYNCNDKWIPSTGVLSITGAEASSATISFDSCSQYTITTEGLATTHNW